MDAFNESLANGIIIGMILFIRYLLFEVASMSNYCGINFTTQDLDSLIDMKLPKRYKSCE